MSRYVLMTHTEQAITSTLYPAWTFLFSWDKNTSILASESEGTFVKQEKISSTWWKEVFLSKTSFILAACMEVRCTGKQPWKIVQKGREKHRGRTAAPVIVPASKLLSCRETPGSTNGVRRWEEKDQEVHQKISGHFYSFLNKFLLILIITLSWHISQTCLSLGVLQTLIPQYAPFSLLSSPERVKREGWWCSGDLQEFKLLSRAFNLFLRLPWPQI